MKNFLRILILFVFCSLILSAETVNRNSLNYDFATKTFTKDGKPFTGTFVIKTSMGDKLVQKTSVKNGMMNGESIRYHNEKPSSIDMYKDNKKNGLCKVYSLRDGSLYKEVNYVNDKKEGLVKTYEPDGKLKTEAVYKNDHKAGAYKMYHNNGRIKISGAYQKYKKVGKWTWYKSDGSVERTKEY